MRPKFLGTATIIAVWATVLAAGAHVAGARLMTPAYERASVQTFTDRVDAYSALRRQVVTARARPEARPGERPDPQRLARAIGRARTDAKQGLGYVFTPEVAWVFRARIWHTLTGRDIEALVGSFAPDEGEEFPAAPVVNGWYPVRETHELPPVLLAVLPRLPVHLEYRAAGTDLVLIDVDAELVVDVIIDVFAPPVYV
jgi:hypothetical protein